MSKIKGKLWGYSKSEVEDYLTNIKTNQEIELEKLRKKIDVSDNEIKSLRDELQKLIDSEAKVPKQTLLEFAITRVDRLFEYIYQDVEIDLLEIQKISDQKIEILKNNLIDIENEINKEKEIIERNLKNIVETVRKQEKSKNINVDVLKNIGKVLPIADWLKNNKEEELVHSQEFWGDNDTNTEKAINKMTSDGTTVNLGVVNEDDNTNQVDDFVNKINNNFWDFDLKNDQNETITKEIAVTDEVENYANSSKQTSQEVRDEITSVRDKYILGKVVGEDITDKNGKIIIRKNESITESVMHLAKNEGKLTELIIHMELPGQGD
ncbi:hypothetical protein DEAC_c18280 [Desulfosporosinus acididurans]|uniref:Uncharacterized protein n=1 Tax=Desulfosporosinus acididurans TaxID=476652 RepID=A0A0J1FSH3_9FIRM|nr:hypothetical protein [Desulfosporosinus acididurans]KLU66429.1 hypothetical protein DEAC_c18280 [Desulfosporosinus acididurans]